MPRSKPKPPPGLAEFVARTVTRATTGPDAVLDALRGMWREAAAGGAEPPHTRSMSARLGISRTMVAEHLAALVRDGRVLRFGGGRYTVYVPREPEFTVMLDGKGGAG